MSAPASAGRSPGSASILASSPTRSRTRWKLKGKLSRATPAIIKAESGQIYLPKSAPWVDEFIGEHVRFKGEGDDHDDQVDVLSYAVQSMCTMVDVPRMIEGTGAPHGWMYGNRGW